MNKSKLGGSLQYVLEGPLVSEKSTRVGDSDNTIVFWVNPKATKRDIEKAILQYYPDVKVDSVRTLLSHREKVRFSNISGQRRKRKKAYIRLAEGHEIQFND